MKNRLSAHQHKAIEAYSKLLARHPALLHQGQTRTLVTDTDLLSAYAAGHDVVLGVAAETPHVLFVVDLVETRSDDETLQRFPYLRVISQAQLLGGTNVVIVATIADPALGSLGHVVLIQQERHATGTSEWELPRGFGDARYSGAESALRELLEETGYVGETAHFLGQTYTDSGTTDARVAFYHVPVTTRSPATPECGEAISNIRVTSLEKLWDEVKAGTIRDGLTVQAMALYDRR